MFAVPREAVEQATRSYEHRSGTAKLLSRPLRTVSGGRLLRRSYVRDADPGINDSLVAQQGPNYALAKRLQRWRASVARDAGAMVSLNVAPPTRTRSVVKNRALAAAYAGAHRFGIEVFEPATANVLMAALLVHDLHTHGGPDCTTIPGRTRRSLPCTAGCGARRTHRAALSGSPPCSGTARPGAELRCALSTPSAIQPSSANRTTWRCSAIPMPPEAPACSMAAWTLGKSLTRPWGHCTSTW